VTWPFVLRAVHEAEIAAKDRELAEARAQLAYWRARSELFIDRAAAKAGITHEPVMRNGDDPPIVHPLDPNPLAGFGINVIDSTRHDGRVAGGA
jgi:hypothetical protein